MIFAFFQKIFETGVPARPPPTHPQHTGFFRKKLGVCFWKIRVCARGACFFGYARFATGVGGGVLVFSNRTEATRRRRSPDRVFAKRMKPLSPSSLVRLIPTQPHRPRLHLRTGAGGNHLSYFRFAQSGFDESSKRVLLTLHIAAVAAVSLVGYAPVSRSWFW